MSKIYMPEYGNIRVVDSLSYNMLCLGKKALSASVTPDGIKGAK